MERHDKKIGVDWHTQGSGKSLFMEFYAGLCKIAGSGKITTNEINARITKMLEQAVTEDSIINIFAESGKKNPEISILSDEYMEQIRRMKHKNIAAELLRKLLEDNIKVIARTDEEIQ